jgi:hypothetical protein
MSATELKQCIRIDNGDGSESEYEPAMAEQRIRESYIDGDAAIEQFRSGVRVRCTFATYELRPCN